MRNFTHYIKVIGVKKILIFIHFIILMGAYAPFLNQWITPSVFQYWPPITLAFPVLLFLDLLVIILWILLKWKIGVVFTLLSLPLYFLVQAWYPFWQSAEKETSDFSLITYNVRYFYDDYKGIENFLKEEMPSVIFFQEMGANPEGIIESLGTKEKYFFENYNSLGVASIYPIIESNKIRYKNYPTCAVYCDVAMPNDTVRFINIYLESLHLDQDELKKTQIDSEEVKFKGKLLVKKVSHAAKIHQNQIKLIQEKVNQSPFPVIIAGDLNAVPTSYEYYALKQNLVDAFTQKGHQLGNTFRTLPMPVKLDYVFSSKNIGVSEYQIIKNDFSDHYPTKVGFKFPK